MPGDITTFRARQAKVDAMHFYGTAESGRAIVDWVFRLGGIAEWRDAQPAFQNADGKGCGPQPGALYVGAIPVPTRSWAVLSDGQWSVMPDEFFVEYFTAAPDIPRSIIVDYGGVGKLTVDGEEFPYPVSVDHPIQSQAVAGGFTVVTIPVLVEKFYSNAKRPDA